MMLFLLFFTLMRVMDAGAQSKHHDMDITMCSDTEKEYLTGLEGDQLFYADFEGKKGVVMLPPFADTITFHGIYEFAEANVALCKQSLPRLIEDFNNRPMPVDAPQTSIYPKQKIQLDLKNTLICHSARFFPPHLTVRWTKNNIDVTNQSSLSQYYPNRDDTYNQFSHLHFTPQEGDVYTCTVQHEALETPDTKTWEVDVELPSVGPAVFCGLGLAVGLLGVATGTFFLVKGNRYN